MIEAADSHPGNRPPRSKGFHKNRLQRRDANARDLKKFSPAAPRNLFCGLDFQHARLRSTGFQTIACGARMHVHRISIFFFACGAEGARLPIFGMGLLDAQAFQPSPATHGCTWAGFQKIFACGANGTRLPIFGMRRTDPQAFKPSPAAHGCTCAGFQVFFACGADGARLPIFSTGLLDAETFQPPPAAHSCGLAVIQI